MIPRLLFIANTSQDFHIGAMLVRAAGNLEGVIAKSDTNGYAPSMNSLWGKLFFRIANRRPREWWHFNRKITEQIKVFVPKLVIVTGIFPLSDDVFQACHQANTKIVNYLTDDPWNPQHYCPPFRFNLASYDCIFSTKRAIIPDLLQAGVKAVHFLPFGFDPSVHYQPDEKNHNCGKNRFPEVCLVGGGDSQRQVFMSEFVHHFKGELGLYGGYWNSNKTLEHFDRQTVYGESYCRVVRFSKINIGLIRHSNRDGHSMRSYEIPACGGLGLYQDTPEHRELFKDYPEYGFFSSPEDLSDKCHWLLDHPKEREEIRLIGIKRVVKDTNTYEARLKTILKQCGVV